MNVGELRKHNCQLEEKLSKSENEDMTKIVAYLRGSKLSEMNQELVRQDILDIILSAKERGEEMQHAIGTDYKVFCDEIIEQFKPKSTKEKIADIMDTIFRCASILVLIKMVFYTAGLVRNAVLKGPIELSVPIQYLDIFSMFILVATSYIVVEVILNDAFDKNGKRTNIIVGVALVAPILTFSLMYALNIGTAVAFEINLIVGYLISVFMYVVSKIYEKKKK